jgi:hypothetical protein
MPARSGNHHNPPGRPEVGPIVNARMPQDLIDWLDEQAKEDGVSRAAFLRSVAERARGNATEPERIFDPAPGWVFSARVYANGRLEDHFSDEDPDLVYHQGRYLVDNVLIDSDVDAALEADDRRRTSSLTLKFTRHRAHPNDVVRDLMAENYPEIRQ